MHEHAYTLPPTPAMHEASDFRRRCACSAREPDIAANLGAQRLTGELARHRHRWGIIERWEGPLHWLTPGCLFCGRERDHAKSRAGTSARRLGHDQERRIERVYGPRKVGEFGTAIDHIGRDFKWQSKATRAPMPDWARWTDASESWFPYVGRTWITRPIEAMQPLRQDLRPLLIRSWVRQGVPTRDIIIVRLDDWNALHGIYECPTEYMAMTGSYFLNVHGRDT